MKIEIYTIPGCMWCSKTEKLLQRANINDYKKYIVGKDIERTTVQERFPFADGYPIIVVDDEVIPGIVDLAKLFVKKGLVSSKKNE